MKTALEEKVEELPRWECTTQGECNEYEMCYGAMREHHDGEYVELRAVLALVRMREASS